MEKEEIEPAVDDSRRKFLEKAGKVSVAAPAAALLLSAGVPQAANAYGGGGAVGEPCVTSDGSNGMIEIDLRTGETFCNPNTGGGTG